jgi:hypothetical protein
VDALELFWPNYEGSMNRQDEHLLPLTTKNEFGRITTMKQLLSILFIALISLTVFAEDSKHSYTPKNGYVPSAETAMKIAEAIWLPIYGEKILKEKPYKATLTNDIWTVEGTLPKGLLGGVAVIEIAKQTAQVLRVSHGK